MKTGSWLDHLPPWMAWGAVASTGAYSPAEITAMAVPLAGAALVEWRGGSLYRFRRLLEIAALAVFLVHVAARTGVLPTVVNTLFALCGVRLCLPREDAQRRQLLLMGFLVFLTTAVSTSELDFLVWALVWVSGSALFLMQLNWEKSALLRHGPVHPAPFRKAPAWLAAVVVMAAGFFVVLPRLRMGVRGLPLGVHGLAGGRAGLSDVLDLAGGGPIQGGGEVALRIVPGPGQPGFERAFALLRAVVLEELDGQRWEVSEATPRNPSALWNEAGHGGAALSAEAFISPSPLPVIPLPYGRTILFPPEGERLRAGPGASVRWWFPMRRILPLKLSVVPQEGEPERLPGGARRDFLTRAGGDTGSALRWSLATAPGDLPPRELAARLSSALRTFRYTLDNPSGGAANPLADFLERTRAGHCEYFASALAVMLRRRGVPARVVNGYRLGTWIGGGGYYLVTRNEAHSWVEYYDPDLRAWRTEDPTPAAPPSALGSGSFMSAMARLADSARFAWDRNVVRFSDEDQVAGLEWLQAKVGGMAPDRLREPLRAGLAFTAAVAALAALAWAARALLPRAPGGPGSPGRLPQLGPLLRAAGRERLPAPGETARVWLSRLGAQRPDRSAHLEALAREADAVAYGGGEAGALARLAREEAKAWRRKARA
ncbi:DUF3488 and transglutaminase-like domain-containing protein [Geothrix sp. 21YS21S-2]|uniref:transglutaminase family protein n=1 Tax=Geothrix sp. 21YS21S-2 TaxID=3068893 RepID=UPI0027B99E8B|nr:DUF3488 and transglutaminase-like domain-containing protein [Geothrix sp. 21YS21S-2]